MLNDSTPTSLNILIKFYKRISLINFKQCDNMVEVYEENIEDW